MRIGILGPLEVRDQAGRPIEVGGRRLRALLIRLAIDAGHAVTADRLIDDLWEGAPPTAPSAALHTLVSRLRAAGVRDLVEFGSGGYRLSVDPGEVDAIAFERAVATAHGDGSQPALRAALRLWRGRPLGEVADTAFAAAPIARLEALWLAATQDRIEADLAAGQAVHLIPELEELAAAHPERERLRGQLMRALYGSGQQAAALQVYQATRNELADRLGVDPSTELAALQLAILRHDPDLLAETRPAASQPEPAPAAGRSAAGQPVRQLPVAGPSSGDWAPRRTNLPAPLTSFVGREEESQQLNRALREARLVTLTGPGGAGKTRLAREVTAGLLDDFVDGVWFVPMAPVSSPFDVPQAVLTALGVPEAVRVGEVRTVAAAVAQPLDRLLDVLAERRLILVLDNCEHLIEALALLADRVLGQAPGVRILATSREPLGITGETLCPLPSLPLPAADSTAEEAEKLASVQLFADRGSAVRPGFVVNQVTAPLVIAICRELDGIPLAIELAAARLRSMTLAQIAARLGDRFRLLNGGNRTALPRHQTLRAVVDWSWDLLDDVERTVLRRLSVFTGGATPDSAERICGLTALDDVHPDRRQPDRLLAERDVVEVIAALIDKSLVITTGEGEVRYRLLETVRAYAAERLTEAGERDQLVAAHADYFIELAERAEPLLRRRDQMSWLDELTAERDNCNAALQHAVEVRDARLAVRFIAALTWFWVMRDYESVAGNWAVSVTRLVGDTAPVGLEEEFGICVLLGTLTEGLAAEPGPAAPPVGEMVTTAIAQIPDQPMHPVLCLARPLAILLRGELEVARQLLSDLLAHPDPWVGAGAMVGLAFLALNDGQIAEATSQMTSSYAIFAELGERWGKTITLRGLTELALIDGDGAKALRLIEEAHGYASEGVSPDQGASMLIALGVARIETGDLDRGRAEIEQGLRQAEHSREHADVIVGCVKLGELDRRAGDLAAARGQLDRAYELIQPNVNRPGFAEMSSRVYSGLGCLTEQEGDLVAAAGWHDRALQAVRFEVIVQSQTVATLTEGLAALAAARGEFERAAELLGTAHALHGYRDHRSFEVVRATTAAVAQLGQANFDAAYQRARELPREQALALARPVPGNTAA